MTRHLGSPKSRETRVRSIGSDQVNPLSSLVRELLRVVGAGTGRVGVAARLAPHVEQPDTTVRAVNQGGRIAGRPELAGILDHLHRRPGLAAVRAPPGNQIDVLTLETRVAQVVLACLREGQQRAIRCGLDGRDTIAKVTAGVLDEQIDSCRRPLRPRWHRQDEGEDDDDLKYLDHAPHGCHSRARTFVMVFLTRS